MNVAFDPWIPVVTLDGKPKLTSLCEVLTEGHLLADLSVRPHERVSLMRLFLCVAHAALDGPKDYDEWLQVPARLPDAAKKYLVKWKDSFELFHATKPWLQIADLRPAKANDEESLATASKLDFAMASGSNTTLFDHPGSSQARDLTMPQLAMGLLSIQNFSTCGLLGRPVWQGRATADSAADAPCIPSSMYHALLVGGCLQASICLNICAYDEVSFLWGPSWKQEAIGRPIWEQMPRSPDDSRSCATYMGRLVPLSRAIKLNKGGVKMLYGEGLRYPVFPLFPREITAAEGVTAAKAKQERYLVGARSNVRPWRQLDAILQYDRGNDQTRGALPLSHMKGEGVDIWVGALIRNPGKQDILDSQESRFHVSALLRSADGCDLYQAEVREAEDLNKRLGWAVEKYRREIDEGWDGRLEAAGPKKYELQAKLWGTGSTQYWTTVERNLGLLMTHIAALGTDEAVSTRDAWRTMLWMAARDAYLAVCGQETPRQIKAFTEGWKKLNAKPKDPETKTKKTKTKKKGEKR